MQRTRSRIYPRRPDRSLHVHRLAVNYRSGTIHGYGVLPERCQGDVSTAVDPSLSQTRRNSELRSVVAARGKLQEAGPRDHPRAAAGCPGVGVRFAGHGSRAKGRARRYSDLDLMLDDCGREIPWGRVGQSGRGLRRIQSSHHRGTARHGGNRREFPGASAEGFPAVGMRRIPGIPNPLCIMAVKGGHGTMKSRLNGNSHNRRV